MKSVCERGVAALRRVKAALDWAGEIFYRIGRVLNYSRISTAIVLAGGLGLILNDQGRDLAAGVGDHPAHVTSFFCTVAIWAFEGWYWARFILTVKLGETRGETAWERFLVNQWPRILGVLSFAFAAFELLRAGHAGMAAVAGVLGIAFFVFAVVRRPLMNHRPRLKALGGPLHAVFVWGSFALIVAAWLLATLLPVHYGEAIGSAAVVFLGLGLLVPIGTFAVYWTHEHGFPILTGTVVLAALFTLLHNDNHALRLTAEAPRLTPVKDAIAYWQKKSPNHRPILVATAGGGLRAAYWTATVLGAAQDYNPRFAADLVAISGVSGGSLGAEVFVASLLVPPEDCSHAGTYRRAGLQGCEEARVQTALDQDFLSATVAAALAPDLLQRILPFRAGLPDRAQALERAWETGFAAATVGNGPGVLAGPFSRQWPDLKTNPAWLPALLLNGTHAETGRRIVTSNLDLKDVLRDGYQYFAQCGQADIRGSTAANNSARFPYVAPAGLLEGCGEFKGHIVDGGYFENFGADTLREFIEANPELCRLRPIVLQISSDPDLARETFDNPANVMVPPSLMDFAYESRPPMTALLSTRSSRGLLATKSLRNLVQQSCHGDFLPFLMHRNGDAAPPLGWVLSHTAQTQIRGQLSDDVNAGVWKTLTDGLRADKRS
jgi:hypothetical protein